MNTHVLSPAAHLPPRTLLVALVSAALALVVGLGLATLLIDQSTGSTPVFLTPGAGADAETEVRDLMHRRG